MILTKPQILKEIESGRVKITPYDETAVGPASIDLTLANEIRIFENIDHSVHVVEATNFKEITKKVVLNGKKYIIKPGELILGITQEHISLPPDICAWLNSRSRFARLGLMVHITAPFIQPGEEGKQVLEIFNTGPNNLELHPGERLCQLILQRCEGEATYEGGFKNQEL
ncbi:MAG: dCTP deaminase [Weeksellaceae bacterium]